jgi:uncharacterized protein
MKHKERIEQELKTALKNRDSLKVSVLRMLISSISYKEIEKKQAVSDDEFHGVVKTMIKQRGESIESFKKGNRLDLVEKEEKELTILKSYAPEQISIEELSSEIEGAIVVCDAKDSKDMGKVMKFLMERLSSRVDGKVLSEMVRNRLSSQRPS